MFQGAFGAKRSDFPARFETVTQEYLTFRKYFPWEATPRELSATEKAETLTRFVSWLEDVRDFLRDLEKLDPADEAFRCGVTTRTRADHAILALSAIVPVPEELSVSIREFPDRFDVEMESGRRYRFTQDMFSHHIENWKSDILPRLPGENVQALEIGCYEGFSTCWILENLIRGPAAHLVCVDLFNGPFFETFKENVASSGKSAQVTVARGDSQSVLRTLGAEPRFDFVYVDGSHTTRRCLEDTVVSWSLLKSGGIMVIDDYELVCAETGTLSVKEAIDPFLRIYGDDLTIVRQNYQVFLHKK